MQHHGHDSQLKLQPSGFLTGDLRFTCHWMAAQPWHDMWLQLAGEEESSEMPAKWVSDSRNTCNEKTNMDELAKFYFDCFGFGRFDWVCLL